MSYTEDFSHHTCRNTTTLCGLAIVWVAFLSICFAANSAAAAAGPIVATVAGKIEGYTHPDRGVTIFKGIQLNNLKR